MILPETTDTAPRAGPLARVSIEHKLPLLFGVVLLVVILSLSAAAVLEMRHTALRVASERTASLAQQFATLFQQSSIPLRAQVTAIAAKPELQIFAKSPNEQTRAAAIAALQYRGPQQEQIIGTELRDSSGEIVLTTKKDPGAADPLAPSERSKLSAIDSTTIGAFRLIGKELGYPIVASVPGMPGHHVIHWRRLSGSRNTRVQLQRLMGSDATLYIANADGSHVTDLERDVTSVVLNHQALKSPQVEARETDGGSRHLVSWAAVPRSPWAVGIDFPMARILAPSNAFIRRIAAMAIVALAFGLFAAWMMSRRLTGPLSEMAVAADAMSNGDYSQRVSEGRSDELGRLGRSFNVMAAEVAQSRQGLEQKVEARTRDLNATLQQLHDAQESLVRREKLVMLGQLAGGVGHELRNPLGVMTNAVYYLKTVLATAPDNVKEYLDIVQQQITLSEKIVSDLLDFARLKPPTRSSASLAEVASEQIDRLGGTNGVVISTELPPDLPKVLVDRIQVGQIMLNLITNGMQAMNQSGRITITARAEQSNVHVEVRDTGPGVAPENSDKIFEPLFTTKARGIGLGLAVSRTLARANEGDLTLLPTAGGGAVFRLTLPVAARNR